MAELPKYFKVLNDDLTSHHGGSGKWEVGITRSVKGPLVLCENGLHFATIDNLVMWLGPAIHPFIPEHDTQIIDASDKLVCRAGKIGPKFDTWNERTRQLFAADCAEHVLPIFERIYPGDSRPRQAIEATREFANGRITKEQYAATYAAAYSAAAAAYDAAAYDTAAAIYAAAAYAAAAAATYAAAYDTYAAAAYAAAAAATYAAERKWQTERLISYLKGEL